MGFVPAKVPFHNFTRPIAKAYGLFLDSKVRPTACPRQRYNDDPRFKANFDKMNPQLAEFMREAVKVYVANKKK